MRKLAVACALSALLAYAAAPRGSGLPELKASAGAGSGGRLARRAPGPDVPGEAAEGVRRGMAEMLALMSAAPSSLPAGRR